MFSAPPHQSERARIAHARSCKDAGARTALELAPVRAGTSRTVVPARMKSLLSGRAIVEVFGPARRGPERVSCGELRR